MSELFLATSDAEIFSSVIARVSLLEPIARGTSVFGFNFANKIKAKAVAGKDGKASHFSIPSPWALRPIDAL